MSSCPSGTARSVRNNGGWGGEQSRTKETMKPPLLENLWHFHDDDDDYDDDDDDDDGHFRGADYF